MTTEIISLIIFGCLSVAVLAGRGLRRLLPDHHLTGDTKDAVKLAMGLVATMSALLLGLLVSSAKDSYDSVRSEIIQMAAKVSLLDRVLHLYGPEAAPLRAQFHTAVGETARQMWSPNGHGTAIKTQSADAIYAAIQSLSAKDDSQRALKAQLLSLAVELAQIRTLLHVQSIASISTPLLVVVICWLLIIFFCFNLIAPPNATATMASLVSAFAVAGAIFLILEMDSPFDGLLQVSSQPLVNAASQFAK
jgi:hypothetical protein